MRALRAWVVPVCALLLAAWAITVLERARVGVEITRYNVGETPVTRMSDGSGGPAVVVAHGFAGSRQMMQGYGLVLARAGYDVHAFDFLGHGRNPVPMSGDVGALSGTTQRLVDQTLTVVDAVDRAGAPVALLGHSMATDVLVRVADAREVGPVVLLSAFSDAIKPRHPTDLLIITGAWEPGLTDFAMRAARMVDPAAQSGETVREDDVRRQALLAPWVEHVAILHSRAGRQAALDWLNGFYGRAGQAGTPLTGWALLALLAAVTALFGPLARLLPKRTPPYAPWRAPAFLAVALLPAIAVPLLAAPIETRVLPVLVADYLALHLALYGVLQIALLAWMRGRAGLSWPRPAMAALLIAWGLGVFGVALDRYGANFWPVGPRVPIIAALCLGAVPFMLADAWLAWGTPLWQRVVARLAFLASLIAAVVLDTERLFFLVMIAPVTVLFWLTFGTMGRAAARRAGPVTAGLALGLILAWALGVSFPLFRA